MEWRKAKEGMLPIQVICPECMEEFEADPLALEYHFSRCRRVSYPGEHPVGSGSEDGI